MKSVLSDLRNDFYHFPLFFWISEFLEKKKSPSPLFVGVNGPQGSGKSTLTRTLVQLFGAVGVRALSISIDDFYLTRKDQVKLGRKFPDNPLLQQRGYPGTHDLELGVATLRALKGTHARGKVKARIPVYDKSKHQGQGDRLPRSEWTVVTQPLDMVFLEGWMLGFTPVSKSALKAWPNARSFDEVNQFLGAYQKWTRFLDVFIHLVPENLENIVEWRVEAEENMKASGKSGMSTEEARSYIQKFIPAYKMYLPGLLKKAPTLFPKKCVRLKIGKNRLPVF